MAEYIGSRISLISKSDIRYVGTLHEINSENSTVALENVRSMGTEDRRQGPGSQPPNERLYEYIVFRGSDVKDLRIEEAPKKEEGAKEVFDDPAILGSTRPPHQQSGTPSQQQQPYNQPPPYAQCFPPYPPPGGFGRGGFPPPGPGGPGFGYPPGPFGAPPPGWPYPPPGQGFPPGPAGPGPFSPQPPQQQGPGAAQQQPPKKQPIPIGPSKDSKAAPEQQKKSELPAAKVETAPKAADVPPTPPVETKPNVAAAIAPAAAPTGPRNGNRAPIPRQAPASTQQSSKPQDSFQSATQAAADAVAQAMKKLPMAQKMSQTAPGAAAVDGSVDNLTKKVQEMRTDDQSRRGAGVYRGRGRGRGGHYGERRQVEVPTTDFDFESANAKFNKEDFAAEVSTTTGDDLPTPSSTHEGTLNGDASKDEEVVIPKAEATYDKKTSFFDNISSELKDKQAAVQGGARGQEFRSEERRKNMETFGQGSVDGGYRRGFGRGRGRGYRGQRGQGFQNRGGYVPRGRGAPAES